MYRSGASGSKAPNKPTSIRPLTRSQQSRADLPITSGESSTTSTDRERRTGCKRAAEYYSAGFWNPLEQQQSAQLSEKQGELVASWSRWRGNRSLTEHEKSDDSSGRYYLPQKKRRQFDDDLFDPLAAPSRTSSLPNLDAHHPFTEQQAIILRLEAEKTELSHLVGVSEKKAATLENEHRKVIRTFRVTEDALKRQLVTNDDRLQVLVDAGRRKDTRIAELEEELRKRKAEREMIAKKKFRFSIEVELDGQAVEEAIADVDG